MVHYHYYPEEKYPYHYHMEGPPGEGYDVEGQDYSEEPEPGDDTVYCKGCGRLFPLDCTCVMCDQAICSDCHGYPCGEVSLPGYFGCDSACVCESCIPALVALRLSGRPDR